MTTQRFGCVVGDLVKQGRSKMFQLLRQNPKSKTKKIVPFSRDNLFCFKRYSDDSEHIQLKRVNIQYPGISIQAH